MQTHKTLGIFFGTIVVLFVVVIVLIHFFGNAGKSTGNANTMAINRNTTPTTPYPYPGYYGNNGYDNYYQPPVAMPVSTSTPIISRGASIKPGIIGTAAVFSGGNTSATPSYIELPKNSSIDGADTWSMSFWVYLNDNTDGTIFAREHDGVDSGPVISVGYSVSFLGQWMPGKPGTIYVHTSNEGHDIWSNTALQTGKWYYVAITSDRNANKVNLYINGVLDNSIQDYGRDQISDDLNNSSVSFGAWLDGQNNDMASSTELNGELDQFAFFNEALTPQQVSGIYNSGKGMAIPATMSGLVTDYDFGTTELLPTDKGSQ